MEFLKRMKSGDPVKGTAGAAAVQRNEAAPRERGEASPLGLVLSDQELEWKQRIHKRLMKVLDLSLLGSLREQDARAQIQEQCQRVIVEESFPVTLSARQKIVKAVEDEILGLGPLEGLLDERSISDILVNRYNDVYVERHGKLEKVNIRFYDNEHLLNIIDRIVTAVGRRIDELSPMVDARLLDGSRVNAIIPPLSIDGPVLSIRRFAVERLDADQLIKYGTITPTMAVVLEAVTRARLNVLISGGTGSGKTTLLNVMSRFIPANERIVTIEDSAELQMQQPHVVRLETRPPNIEGRGEVPQRELVRNSLRMRPDRIIVGEVRGSEALDMLQAMNTGHDGSLTTVHANSPRDALTRIESMVAMTGLNLPSKPVRAQIASAINVVLQMERQQDGTRRLTSVQEIGGMEGDIITMSEVFKFERLGMDADGQVIGKFKATGIVPKFHSRLKQYGIDLDLQVFDPDREI
jgi:pilus assembly protein CpaF